MDPFLAEIRIFAGNFAPRGWALCQGQLMPISQNTALFSLVGTFYGGDGRSTFGLPDLQQRVPMHPNDGGGLSYRQLGEQGGEPDVTLIQTELPAHNHSVASGGLGTSASPDGAAWGSATATPHEPMYAAASSLVPMAGGFSGPSTVPHNNMQPYLNLNFIIALQGIFPSRP